MRLISIIIILVGCGLMFYVKRSTKMAIFLLGLMLFSLVRVPEIPFGEGQNFLIVSFLLSEWRRWKGYLLQITSNPVVFPLFLVCVSSAICIYASPYVNNSTRNIVAFIMKELFFKYLIILYAFWGFDDENSIKPCLRWSFYGLLVLTFFGIINLIDKSAIYVNVLTESQINELYNVSKGDLFTERERFRVQSMFSNPFNYGYICLLLMILHYHAFIYKMENKKISIIALSCCLFGIVVCNCRTIHLCTIIVWLLYFLMSIKRGRRAKRIGLAVIGVSLISVFTVPFLRDKVYQMTTMFDEGYSDTGSSLEMRTMQYVAMWEEVQGHEWTGLGKGYFVNEMGWGGTREEHVNEDLKGLEGVILYNMFERGYVGVFFWFIFYFLLFLYIRKNRFLSPSVYYLGISVLILYLLFANMTGELRSVYPTLLILGYVIKVLYVKRGDAIVQANQYFFNLWRGNH